MLQLSGHLTMDEWTYLLKGARYRAYTEGQTVLEPSAGGRTVDGLLQVVSGTMRVEKPVPGRPQDLVVGRLGSGELIGVTSLIFRNAPFAKVVCDSEEAATIRLPRPWLDRVFAERPLLAGKFYFFLAQRQASRLQKVTSELADAKELRLNDRSGALPKTLAALSANEAFFMLYHKFVRSLKPEEKRRRYECLMQFVQAARALQREPDPEAIAKAVRSIRERHIKVTAAHDIFAALPPGPYREQTLRLIQRAFGHPERRLSDPALAAAPPTSFWRRATARPRPRPRRRRRRRRRRTSARRTTMRCGTSTTRPSRSSSARSRRGAPTSFCRAPSTST